MNKPAPKEPSMDEILSSIRQIIADDDASALPRRAASLASVDPMQAAPAQPSLAKSDRDFSDMLDDIEPLALSASQIVDDGAEDGLEAFSFDSILADTPSDHDDPMAMVTPALVDPEDISFAPAAAEEDEGLPSFDPPGKRAVPADPKQAAKAKPAPVQQPQSLMDDMDLDMPAFNPEPALEPEADLEAAFDIPDFNPEPAAAAKFTPEPAVDAAFDAVPDMTRFAAPATSSAMPDATLSSDLAAQLVEPATKAAVRSSMTKLNNIGLGNTGATIESLMRDMLRPMLKEWLDENLPSMVERMVEKEIARVSHGD